MHDGLFCMIDTPPYLSSEYYYEFQANIIVRILQAISVGRLVAIPFSVPSQIIGAACFWNPYGWR